MRRRVKSKVAKKHDAKSRLGRQLLCFIFTIPFEKSKYTEFKGSLSVDETHFNPNEELINSRARNFGPEQFKMTYSFIKAIALTAATAVLFNLCLRINFKGDIDVNLLLNFLLWSVSLMILLVTYDAAMFGTIFILLSLIHIS